jgi:N6-L-threonylcarbamoyladenine synthase
MFTLGIETTCDETAASVVKDGLTICSNVIASQINLHDIYGGVVPELACRRHIDMLIPVIKTALHEANVTLDQIDLIAAAMGPGLIGALLIGLNSAKALAFSLNKPFIGVNHVEAHLFASYMCHHQQVEFPALGVVISGGHTCLVLIETFGCYKLIGQTTDDAIGEAFDKVAAQLKLPYPGGPQIERLAIHGNSKRYAFKAGVVKDRPFDFSFSGLKTNVMYTLKGQSATKSSPLTIQEEDKKDIAASFQETALKDVVKKSLKAAAHFNCKCLLIGGGVSNNQYLRKLYNQYNSYSLPIFFPSALMTQDNAAMIAGLGHFIFNKTNTSDSLDLEAKTRIAFSS